MNELDIIAQIRGEVMQKKEISGKNPFLIWGYSIAIAYLLTFGAMMLWNNSWCLFILCGIIPGASLSYVESQWWVSLLCRTVSMRTISDATCEQKRKIMF